MNTRPASMARILATKPGKNPQQTVARFVMVQGEAPQDRVEAMKMNSEESSPEGSPSQQQGPPPGRRRRQGEQPPPEKQEQQSDASQQQKPPLKEGSARIRVVQAAVDSMELMVEEGGDALALGAMLKLNSDSPVYGTVSALKTNPSDGKQTVQLAIIHGTPVLSAQEAEIVKPEGMTDELQGIRGQQECPLSISGQPVGNLDDLQTLTLVKGQSIDAKKAALVSLLDAVKPFYSVIVIDPIGMLANAPSVQGYAIGKKFRLSLQQFGVHRFIATFAKLLPESLQPDALKLLASVIPSTSDFIPFKQVLHFDQMPDSPAKSPLLHLLYGLYQQRVFADREQDVFSLKQAEENTVTVLDLSALSEPWKSSVYESLFRDVLQQGGQTALLGLIYPEKYLGALRPVLYDANEAGAHLVCVSLPYEEVCTASMADNTLSATIQDGQAIQIEVQGRLTAGFPLQIKLQPDKSSGRTVESLIEQILEPSPQYQQFSMQEDEEGESSGQEEQPEPPAPRGRRQPQQPEHQSGYQPEPRQEEQYAPPPQPEPRRRAPRPQQQPEYQWEQPEEEQGQPLQPPQPQSQRSQAKDWEQPYSQQQQQPQWQQHEQWQPQQERGGQGHEQSRNHQPEAHQGMPSEDVFSFSDAEPQGQPQQPDWQQQQPPQGLEDDDEFSFNFDLDDGDDPQPPPSRRQQPEQGYGQGYGQSDGQYQPDDQAQSPNEGQPPQGRRQPQDDEQDAYFDQAQRPEQGNGAGGAPVQFNEGEEVHHPKYGRGIVNKVIPMEDNVVLNITFDSVGKRLLDPQFSKLEKA